MTRERVVAWLAEQYEPATAGDVAAAFGESCTRQTVHSHLSRAEALGLVVRVGRREMPGRRKPEVLWVHR